MTFAPRAVLLAGAAFCALLPAGVAVAQDELALNALALAENQVDAVVVTGVKARTSAVTGLDLTLRETPQSVTQITQDRIDQFGLTNVNDLLAQAPGINVEKVETDRTYYNSRGFDITNFQVDGIGLPLVWGIQFGDLDTVLFDRVDIVRGANSMMTGTGNPSATINYIRKRPTRQFQGEVAAEAGSWDQLRGEIDLSGPLSASGSVRGRLIAAQESADSYLDYKTLDRTVLAGLVAWDITYKLTATAGYSVNDNRADGVLWGALPLQYSDGRWIDYPVSASTSADWTFWNVRDQTAFAELDYGIANGWRIKGVVTYKQFDELAKLLYAYNNPDPATGLGVEGMAGIYPSTYESAMLDVFASGPITLFGREHQIVVGAQTSRSSGLEYEDFSTDTIVYPAVGQWGQTPIPQPSYPGQYLATDQTDRLHRLYAAAHLNLTDRLKAVVGVNLLRQKSAGYSYGTPTPRDEDAASPYVGAVFDLTDHVSLYASYTDIFNPQSEVDINAQVLPPAHGKSYETGVKSEWLGRRLYITAALFKSEQDGLAEYAGDLPNGRSYHVGLDTIVKGYEFEAVGALTDQWSISAGWTDLEVEGASGDPVRLYLPRRTLKAMTTYTFPSWRNLTVGAAIRWQDEVFGQDLTQIRQEPYALLDLTAGIDVTPQVRATLNVRNAADEKHLQSLMWNQSFYGAARNATVRLTYTF